MLHDYHCGDVPNESYVLKATDYGFSDIVCQPPTPTHCVTTASKIVQRLWRDSVCKCGGKMKWQTVSRYNHAWRCEKGCK